MRRDGQRSVERSVRGPVPLTRPGALPDVLLGGLALVATHLMFLWSRREPVFSDDLSYWSKAGGWTLPLVDGGESSTGSNMAPGALASSTANDHRMLLHLAVLLARVVLGDTPTAFAAVPYLAAMGAALGTFLLVARLTDATSGFVAVIALLALVPFQRNIAVLTPDWPAAALVALSVALLVIALTMAASWRRTLTAVASGLTVGAAFGVSEQATFAILGMGLIAAVLLFRGRSAVVLAWSAGGIAAFLADMGASWVLTGSPLGRIQALIGGGHVGGRIQAARSASVAPERFVVETDPGLEGAPVTWPYLTMRYLDLLWTSAAGRLLLIALVVAIFFVLVRWRRGEIALIGVTALTALAGVSLAATSIDPPIPLLRLNERYLAPSLPLLVAFAVIAIHRLAVAIPWVLDGPRGQQWRPAKLALPAFAFLMLVGGVADTSLDPRFVRNGETAMRDIAAHVANTDGPVTVWADFRTAQGIHLFLDPVDRSRVTYLTSFDTGAAERSTPSTPVNLAVLNLKRFSCGTDYRGSCVNPVPTSAAWPDATLDVIEAGYPFSDIRLAVPAPDATVRAFEWRALDAAFTAFLQRGATGGLVDAGGGAFLLDAATDVRVALGPGDGFSASDPPETLMLRSGDRAHVAVEVGWSEGVWVRRVEARTFGPDGRLLDRSRLYVTGSNGDRVTFGGAVPLRDAASVTIFAIIAGSGEATFGSPVVAERLDVPRP